MSSGGICGARSHVALREYDLYSGDTPTFSPSTAKPEMHTSPSSSLSRTAPVPENTNNALPISPTSPAAQLGRQYSAGMFLCMICVFVMIAL